MDFIKAEVLDIAATLANPIPPTRGLRSLLNAGLLPAPTVATFHGTGTSACGRRTLFGVETC
jgi:hypothetical protein